ncbi:hypothetical protein NC652_041358 [Populus alba x Populus x berolinensis]|nr:hypothetical protein NC652_041358 [Populus alba x Populus x berolinensis]
MIKDSNKSWKLIKEMGCISAGKKGNYGGVRVVGGSETVRGDGGER